MSNAAMLEPIGPTPRQTTNTIVRNLEVNLVADGIREVYER